jgi:hypothetical protein
MPDVGVTVSINGILEYVNWSVGLVELVPLGVMTVISIKPGEWVGTVAVMVVSESTVNELALVVPNFTLVAPVNVVPVIVMFIPPDAGPLDVESAVTVGADGVAEYVN